MTYEQQVAEILFGLIGLVALLVTVFVCLPRTRTTLLRQQLFDIRDDLFDFALDGGISFNHPAYKTLRMRINHVIRSAHRVSFGRFLITMFLISRNQMDNTPTPFSAWKQSVDEIQDDQVQAKLLFFHDQMIRAMVGSFVLTITIPTAFVTLSIVRALTNTFLRYMESFAQWFEEFGAMEQRIAALPQRPI